jgi:4-hydroxybenzoate polyprenyltransferase
MPSGVTVARVFDDRAAQLPAYLKAMRPQQWLKNLLLFVPLLLAHKIGEQQLLIQNSLAFVAFGLCASSVYLLNDLLDLPADRHHDTKRHRPFAAGSISVLGGTVLVFVLLIASAGIALRLSLEFQVVLAFYYLVTLSYSIGLKRAPIIDVLVLAGLYTLRIIAGAAAVMVVPSFWILAFSMFLFLSLALAKRFAELSGHTDIDNLKGRGYRAVDLDTLSEFGTASGYVAVLVLALYINGETVQGLYNLPYVLWALCPIMLYLVSRIWLLARRQELDEDPVVFFVRDRRSQVFVLLGAIALFIAR